MDNLCNAQACEKVHGIVCSKRYEGTSIEQRREPLETDFHLVAEFFAENGVGQGVEGCGLP
jgi:hypothetical protein